MKYDAQLNPIETKLIFKSHFTLIWSLPGFPGLPPYKKHGNYSKSYMVIYENIKVIESA